MGVGGGNKEEENAGTVCSRRRPSITGWLGKSLRNKRTTSTRARRRARTPDYVTTPVLLKTFDV
eukprot:3246247-Pyramimonas_sp.AAC.1